MVILCQEARENNGKCPHGRKHLCEFGSFVNEWTEKEGGPLMPLVRTGVCCACGDCCDPLFSEIRDKAYSNAGLVYKAVNRSDGDGCISFDERTRLCREYENRPSNCRAFPLHPVEITVLPRCTFTFEVRK